MYLKQGDLFWGMSKDFVKDAMQMATNLSFKEGDKLFGNGDDANHFFILLKGSVLLQRGDTGPKVYIARKPGEIIGWSALISRDAYSASAKCLEDTSLTKIEGKAFLETLEKDSNDKAILFERLAKMKRQASVLVLRFITDEYAVPLGVWVVREAVRKAMISKPIGFDSKELMLSYAKLKIKKDFNYDLDCLLRRSFLMKRQKQKKLTSFLA